MNEATPYWNKILDYVKTGEGKDLHKFYSSEGGWLRLSDRNGKVYEIRDYDHWDYFMGIVKTIRLENQNNSRLYPKRNFWRK